MIAIQMRSIILMSVDINSVADMQQYIVDPVKLALNSTYHTILQSSAGQLAFGWDMVMPTSYIANWHLIRLQRQQQTDKNAARENETRIPNRYRVGDLLLLLPDRIISKLAKPT
jgi:hypothetical protein